MSETESYSAFVKNGLYDQLLNSINQQYSDNTKEFLQYQNNPTGFGEDVLCDNFTDDVKCLMESVRDNPITIAKSANATGKTHAAARVAVWWYKCFPGSQVYTAAAPPGKQPEKTPLGGNWRHS